MRGLVLAWGVLATGVLRAGAPTLGVHGGVLLPGCGLRGPLHGEAWGAEAGLALIQPLGPRAEGRLEATFGGLTGHAPGPRSQVNVERLAFMAAFRYQPWGRKPFLVLALGASRFRSRMEAPQAEVSGGMPWPPVATGEPWRRGPREIRMPAGDSVPGEGTGFRPTWGAGLGLGLGRHLEGEIRWEAMVFRGRTLGAWQWRAGFRF